MKIPRTCPDVRDLQALLEGAGGEPGDWADHLEGCDSCQQALESLTAAPPAWQLTARGLEDAARGEPALRRMVERLKSGEPPPGDDGDLSFLRPADSPGVIGWLGPYEVREEVGRGGMGVVLLALDPDLNRVVAIKVLSPALAGSATARRRFVREGRAAAAVCHDNVVTVHAVSESEGLPYLVMQYVAGESLQARLDRTGPLAVEEVVRIGMQTAAGLAAAHAQGLIHRDIKPANLLLEDGLAKVKITDFGLARMADDVGLTRDGVVAGTPEYMAPEQARGEVIDHRADLFSLGGVLYACCTGRPPFRGPSAVAVLRRVSDEEPRSVRALNADLPAWLETLWSPACWQRTRPSASTAPPRWPPSWRATSPTSASRRWFRPPNCRPFLTPPRRGDTSPERRRRERTPCSAVSCSFSCWRPWGWAGPSG
jgi:serine/threonine-protein kinase